MRVTVIVPTYDHGPLIEYAVGSALTQTERDLEVLIVGDGVPDTARPAIERVVASDPRVRFIDRPKAPGHGFRHRDEVIREEAHGDVVLYLSDDDVWAPEHVELLCTALEKAEFVASLPLGITPTEVRLKVPHNLADPRWRKQLIAGRSMISMSLIGHSRELYSRLETGWRRDDTYYVQVWSDLARHTKRMATVPRATAVILPDTKRTDMSPDERLAEIAEMAELMRDPARRLRLLERLLEFEVRRWSVLTLDLERLRKKAGRAKDSDRF